MNLIRLVFAIYIGFGLTLAHARMVADGPMDSVVSPSVSKTTPEPPEGAMDTAKVKFRAFWNTAKHKFNQYRGNTPAPAVAKNPEVVKPTASATTATLTPEQVEEKKQQEIVADLKTNMPAYKSEEKSNFKAIISETSKAIGSAEVLRQVSPGRVGTTDLQRTKAGVPQFYLTTKKEVKTKKGQTKVIRIAKKHIPLLDIGEEPRITKGDLVPSNLKVNLDKYKTPEALPSPKMVSKSELDKWTKKKITLVTRPKILDPKNLGLGKVVTQRRIDKVDVAMKTEIPLEAEKPLVPMTENELKMLTAMILYKKGGKCHIVSGMFFELEKSPKYFKEANYHLGKCAHEMGFHSEAVNRLTKVIAAEDADYGAGAVESIVDQLPKEYEVEVGQLLEGLKNKSLITAKAQDIANYIMAKSNYRRDRFKTAQTFAEKVSTSTDLYAHAQYLAAISQYSRGNATEAAKMMASTRDWMTRSGHNDPKLESLIAINLGRIHFRKNEFKTADLEYRKIAKNNSFWIQGLIELGWTQLQMGDFAGAIGNMYSLHSPYFRYVYQPESYVVRTIGYINICQFGDAYRTLTQLERQHNSWLASADSFIKTKKKARDYYDTVAEYIRSGDSGKAVNGLPAQVIREVARQRDFLNAQAALNTKVDELAQYKFINGMIRKDQKSVLWRLQQAKKRIKENKANIAKAKTDKTLIQNVNQWKANLRNDQKLAHNLYFELKAYEEGRLAFAKFRTVAEKNLEKENYKIKEAAGRALVAHLRTMRSQMDKIIENNEFLRYEVYSGAGENIRYQVAGGESAGPNRVPSSIKPKKIMNWQFDGEYWEDEIGAYRSSLRNNCPQYGQVNYTTKTKKK
ncbi:MAG: hypothetical protein H6626_08875 [Pseudobdellovibrionaceae bacterium]|nr:hypothetical protein [Bdellovibrionales bacterium]USN46329.1 MAG: hypothetical protein H6626_08875 [Pseudobdellovibrionaceae bacterium]